jgi:hypothetical protein
MSQIIAPSPLLRFALRLDTIASLAAGLLLSTSARLLSTVFLLPEWLLLMAGAICLAWSTVLAVASTRERLSRSSVIGIMTVNGFWVFSSGLVVLAGWFSPSGLGVAFVLAQAAAVAFFMELQFFGLKRSQHGHANSAA